MNSLRNASSTSTSQKTTLRSKPSSSNLSICSSQVRNTPSKKSMRPSRNTSRTTPGYEGNCSTSVICKETLTQECIGWSNACSPKKISETIPCSDATLNH